LLEACRIVGAVQGIEFKLPPAQLHALGVRDPLGELVRASGVRSRAVTLRPGWWRGDHGPLLGFLGKELRPVALMPTPAGGYEIRDPSGARADTVDVAAAGRIAPTAYAFYRTFGAAAVRIADLLRFAGRGLRRDLTWIAVMGGLGGLVGLVGPYLNQPLFDDAIPNAERAQVLQIVFALLGAALAGAMFDVTQSLSVLRVEGTVDQAAQAGVWDRLLRLPAPFFRRYTAGDLTLRAGAVGAIRAAVAGTTVNGLLAATFSLTSLALLLSLSVPLAALTLVLALLLVLLMLPGTWLKLRLERGIAEAGGRLSGTVFQLLTGVAKLRVSAAEGRAFALWARQYARQERMVLRMGSTEAYLNVVLTVFPLVASMALFLAVAAARGEGRLTTGEFLAFNAAFGTFLGGATGIFYALTDALEALPLYERLAPILETETESPAGRANPGPLSGRIELSGVFFRYGSESPQVLHDVSIEVRPGEFVAIVGASGSGKSTLLRLLLGFERPTAGSVFYDGQDLSGLDVGAVRRQMGVVLQNGQLLGGDIYTSVSGVAQLPVAEVLDALRACGLEEDVQAMPMGVYSVLPEGGSTLSGGQRQRLMLARAVAARPRLLLLDEATSALDNRSQAIVTASMEALKITRVVIAHRLSTIVSADRIYVLDAGRVVQRGTYAELMAQDGLFRRLASRQTTGDASPEG
jgi:ATP-binding cassette subfamily C protein